MKTKKQIEACIKKIQKEYSKLPEFSYFNDPNWKIRDKKIETLKECIGRDKVDLEDELDNILEVYGDDYMENPLQKAHVYVYDWVLGNMDEI